PQGIATAGNDLWRVVAQDDGTVLKFNNAQVAVLNRGQVYEAPLTAPGLLFASKKVMVALYKKTHSNSQNLRPGDPFMMIIPPRSQYLTKYRYTNIQAAGSFDQQFITLVTTRSNVADITYDGTRLSATFTDIPNTCFAYANVAVTDQAHTIESPQPVGLYVYGFGDADSYGYVGGMALRPDVEGVDIDA
ncbi:MAG: IgGFc-binding protein, partial [Candidatus Kapaibacterium sp.]